MLQMQLQSIVELFIDCCLLIGIWCVFCCGLYLVRGPQARAIIPIQANNDSVKLNITVHRWGVSKLQLPQKLKEQRLSPFQALSTCEGYLNEAKIFDDLTTNYTQFYPTPAIAFHPARSSICQSSTDLKLLVAVVSRRSSVARRHSMRQFYSKVACKNSTMAKYGTDCEEVFSRIKIVFFVGMTQQSSSPGNFSVSSLYEEQLHNDDVIELSVDDDYMDLTTKTLAMLQWATVQCSNAQFVMKLDDDTLVHLGNLVDMVSSYQYELRVYRHFIVGHLKLSRYSVSRDADSPWYIPKSVYPSDAPTVYMFGCGYFMPLLTGKLLFEAASCVQTISIEDLFLTGFLAQSLKIKLLANFCIECSVMPQSLRIQRFQSLALLHHADEDDMAKLLDFTNSFDTNIMRPCRRH